MYLIIIEIILSLMYELTKYKIKNMIKINVMMENTNDAIRIA
jgi:hypothetical protein